MTPIKYYKNCSSRKDSERMQPLYKKVENALKISQISTDVKSVLRKINICIIGPNPNKIGHTKIIKY